MITAEEARKIGEVAPLNVALALAVIYCKIRDAATNKNEIIIKDGLAVVSFERSSETPQATPLMRKVSEELQAKGFSVLFESFHSGDRGPMPFVPTNSIYGMRISW
jgi:hypothetical protein